MTSNKVATLDVALRSLPKPKATVAFGLDSPLYVSGHSAIARLAPEGGAMVHVAKYLRSDETAGGDIERELEGLMEMMQPGWRTHVVFKQYLPNLMVTHAEATAAQVASQAVRRLACRRSTTCWSPATGSVRAASCPTPAPRAPRMRWQASWRQRVRLTPSSITMRRRGGRA